MSDDDTVTVDTGVDEVTVTPPEPLTLYRCTECGKLSVSIGWLHAHIDGKHRGWGPFNLLPPIWPTYGHYPSLMAYTQTLRVTEYTVVDHDA